MSVCLDTFWKYLPQPWYVLYGCPLKQNSVSVARFPLLRHGSDDAGGFPQVPGADREEVRRREVHLLGQPQAGARHLRQRKALHGQRAFNLSRRQSRNAKKYDEFMINDRKMVIFYLSLPGCQFNCTQFSLGIPLEFARKVERFWRGFLQLHIYSSYTLHTLLTLLVKGCVKKCPLVEWSYDASLGFPFLITMLGSVCLRMAPSRVFSSRNFQNWTAILVLYLCKMFLLHYLLDLWWTAYNIRDCNRVLDCSLKILSNLTTLFRKFYCSAICWGSLCPVSPASPNRGKRQPPPLLTSANYFYSPRTSLHLP